MRSIPPPRSVLYSPPSQKYFVGLNRASLRGYAWAGAILFAVLAVLAWPSLLWVAGLASAGALLLLSGVWMHLFLHDSDRDPDDPEGRNLDREPSTHEMD